MNWQRSSFLAMAVALLAASLHFAGSALAAPAATSPANVSSDDGSPGALVRATVENELAAAQSHSVKHMFRSRRQTTRGSQTKLYVETTDAMVGMLIADDDKPISEKQTEDECARLQRLATNPDDLRRKQRQEREDAEHTIRIVRALPDAFLYEFDGTEPKADNSGRLVGELVRLKFRPNPRYSPPSHVEHVLTGMQGYLLIDKTAHRLARIDATLFKEVSFGWGILGHLDQGGHFLVEQADVGDGSWDIKRLQLSLTGKIMMFKKLSIKSDETFSDFQRVPEDTTFAKGIELLKAEQARLQRGVEGTATAKKNGR
jgi:hypothetical protein